jgi:hypothetical protein
VEAYERHSDTWCKSGPGTRGGRRLDPHQESTRQEEEEGWPEEEEEEEEEKEEELQFRFSDCRVKEKTGRLT